MDGKHYLPFICIKAAVKIKKKQANCTLKKGLKVTSNYQPLVENKPRDGKGSIVQPILSLKERRLKQKST